MGLDDRLGDADEGGAAHLAGVHLLFKLLQPAGHQHRRQLGQNVFLEHGLQFLGHISGGALHGLEEDVARVAVRYNDIHLAEHRLPGLHIAHEVNPSGLVSGGEQGVGLPLQVGALGGLRADVQQAHLGLGALEHPLGVVGAHKGKLEQVLRGTLGGGAAVDEHRPAGAGGHHGSQGGPADAPHPLDHQGGGGEQGAGAAGGHKGVAVPVFQHIKAHGKGGVLLLPEGGGGVVAHLHHLAGVGNLQAGGQLVDAVVLQDLEDVLPAAHQDNLHPQLTNRGQRAPHIGGRRVVAAHGVYDDLHMVLLFFLCSFHIFYGSDMGRATIKVAPTGISARRGDPCGRPRSPYGSFSPPVTGRSSSVSPSR